jgi:DNA-binding transcriptional MerR regulator
VKVIELLMRETLPRKNFFKASEVSSLLNVKPHEIRYWETEFPQIRSQKTKSGQRIYRREDVILFSAIKHLLQERKFTLPGAQRIIAASDEFFSANSIEAGANLAIEAENVDMHDLSSLSEQGKIDDREIINLFPDALDSSRVLEEASRLLDEDEDEFDEVTHQIYRQYADEMAEASTEVETQDLGELIKDVVEEDNHNKNCRHLAKLEYEKTLAILMASRNSLTELLVRLEQYGEPSFGGTLN